MFDPKEPEAVPNIPYPGTDLTPEQQDLARMMSQTPTEAPQVPDNIEDLLSGHGVKFEDNQTVQELQGLLEEEFNMPGSEGIAGPGGSTFTSMPEYMSFLNKELQPSNTEGQPTLSDLAGDKAPGLIENIVSFQGGSLAKYDALKDYLSTLPPEKLQVIMDDPSPFQSLVFEASRDEYPNPEVASLMDMDFAI